MKNNNVMTSDLHIWNNAAFDNGDSESDSILTLRSSYSSDCVDSFENQNPIRGSAIQPVSKHGVAEKKKVERGFLSKTVDEEIEEIESEISRLTSRLEVLKLIKIREKENVAKNREMGRDEIVPLQPLEVAECGESARNSREMVDLSAQRQMQRRCLSLVPNEIVSFSKFEKLGKHEIITPLQSRRKSCLLKLQDTIEEEELKGKTGIVRSRKAVTTVGLRKGVKKEESVLSSIQPKKLFLRDGEKLVKTAVKPGRIVASRYNHSTVNSAARKRLLPDNDKDDEKRFDKKRASLVGKGCGGESRVKKRWEIPSEVVVHQGLEMKENYPPTDSVMRNKLPRIRAARCAIETPRDSGPAKRVAELVGRKSYFSDNETEPSVCQALSFIEDYEEEED